MYRYFRQYVFDLPCSYIHQVGPWHAGCMDVYRWLTVGMVAWALKVMLFFDWFDWEIVENMCFLIISNGSRLIYFTMLLVQRWKFLLSPKQDVLYLVLLFGNYNFVNHPLFLFWWGALSLRLISLCQKVGKVMPQQDSRFEANSSVKVNKVTHWHAFCFHPSLDCHDSRQIYN